MLCYHKEYFALGFLSAFFIFAIVTLFEDVIKRWIERIKKELF
jgi:hypothetical protein